MRNRSMDSRLAAVLALFLTPALFAQTALPPRTATPAADLSGVWIQPADGSRYIQADPPPLQPGAMEIYKRNRAGVAPNGRGLAALDPSSYCFPRGAARLMMDHPFELIQRPDQIILLFDVSNGVRRIYTDGRRHPEEWPFGWMGHSTATWQGNTLVADTIGFNERTWLDVSGTPHSDALHVVERFRRVNQGNLEVEFLLEDPQAFTRPVETKRTYQLKPDTEVLARVACEEFLKVEGSWKSEFYR